MHAVHGRLRWLRYCACGQAGVEPRVTKFEGDWRQAIAFVKSANVARRHLSAGERAMVAATITNIKHGGDRKGDQAPPGELDQVSVQNSRSQGSPAPPSRTPLELGFARFRREQRFVISSPRPANRPIA